MQTCSQCHTESPDSTLACPNCQADLREFSMTAVTLKRFQENTRVNAVHIAVQDDACPACQEIQGTFPKDRVPKLPVEGCSHEHGCRCFYQPLLENIFP